MSPWKMPPVLPLPEGWSAPEVVDDTIVAAGLELSRAGVASVGPGGLEVTGSAASRDGSARARAGFELLERIATVEALSRIEATWPAISPSGAPVGEVAAADAFPSNDPSDGWRFARSNGVALHAGWAEACVHARAELAERDRVLSSWYGQIAPIAIDAPDDLRALEGYEWRACVLPAVSGSWSEDVTVACLIGFPLAPANPLALGYGAALAVEAAVAKATQEALQSLAFLWGESIPETAPSVAPAALGHLEHWLYPGHHARLRAWLDGEHARFRRHAPTRDGSGDVRFLDLTPEWLACGLRVAKAVCAAAEPLAFGVAPFSAHLPEELRVHPIV